MSEYCNFLIKAHAWQMKEAHQVFVRTLAVVIVTRGVSKHLGIQLTDMQSLLNCIMRNLVPKLF